MDRRGDRPLRKSADPSSPFTAVSMATPPPPFTSVLAGRTTFETGRQRLRRLGVDAEDGAGCACCCAVCNPKSEPNPGEEILGSSAAAAGCDSQSRDTLVHGGG
ncbi:hypothetical protein WMY93_033256 [Mugilogobius chulae]|uniref:Uncharacterized protein n=1 Tax=Mugilogobius chulae TaxID=88201 RepID=A0AAW0MLN6_9GOBI